MDPSWAPRPPGIIETKPTTTPIEKPVRSTRGPMGLRSAWKQNPRAATAVAQSATTNTSGGTRILGLLWIEATPRASVESRSFNWLSMLRCVILCHPAPTMPRAAGRKVPPNSTAVTRTTSKRSRPATTPTPKAASPDREQAGSNLDQAHGHQAEQEQDV